MRLVPIYCNTQRNPVDWHPWTEQNLKKAKTLNKPNITFNWLLLPVTGAM